MDERGSLGASGAARLSRGDQTGPEVLLGWPLAQPQRGVWSFDGGTWVAVGRGGDIRDRLGFVLDGEVRK